jgi:ParB-like chromosome segregation protein Spo0J
MTKEDTIVPIDYITIKPEYEDMIFEMDTSSFESLKSSIKEDGLEVPIAINDVGVLLDGHHRLKALKEIGKSKVWVIKYQFDSDLDEELFVVDVNLK